MALFSDLWVWWYTVGARAGEMIFCRASVRICPGISSKDMPNDMQKWHTEEWQRNQEVLGPWKSRTDKRQTPFRTLCGISPRGPKQRKAPKGIAQKGTQGRNPTKI
eukprot:2527259-Amphidinium_carterae.1